MVANEMRKNGIYGSITISESTKNMLEQDKNNRYDFVYIKPFDWESSKKNRYLLNSLNGEKL